MPTDPAETRRPEWQAWNEAAFGSECMVWHDGRDTDGVDRLKGETPATR